MVRSYAGPRPSARLVCRELRSNEGDTVADLDLEQLHDAMIVTADGHELGPVGQIFLDEVTDAPVYVTVPVGLLGSRSTFVPLQGAQLADGTVTVPFDRVMIKQAPLLDPDGRLDGDQTAEINTHYGLLVPE
ncbi:PRC-barrel domain containing protein [Propionibacteriaceae bacterium Y1685]